MELWFGVGSFFVGIAMGVVTWLVPPDKLAPKMRKALIAIAFGIGVFGFGLCVYAFVKPKETIVTTQVEHTHVEWLGPAQVKNFPLLPLREGKSAHLGLGYRNAGDFSVLSGATGVVVALVPRVEVKGSFKKLYDGITNRDISGVSVAHASPTADWRYATYLTPILTRDDITKLNNGELRMCAVGSVIWTDASGEYETYLYRCMFVQPDGSFNWNIEAEDNREHKR